MSAKVDWVVREKGALESDLQDLLSQKEDLDVRLKKSGEELSSLEKALQLQKSERLRQLLGKVKFILCYHFYLSLASLDKHVSLQNHVC